MRVRLDPVEGSEQGGDRPALGVTPHDFVLKAPEADIDIEVTLGETPTVVRFTPTRAGSYAFYCSKQLLFLKSHRERGMHGILEVVDTTPVSSR